MYCLPADCWTKTLDYGALFIGGWAAEVLGGYGAGPNHTLSMPTIGQCPSVCERPAVQVST